MEDNEMMRKIKKSEKYSNELERFEIVDFTVNMESEHSTRIIKYSKEDGYSCTCDFYKKANTCSHIMAVEEIIKEKLNGRVDTNNSKTVKGDEIVF